jgi:hypothetical protein
LVQAFLKKLWVESDFKAPNLPLSLRLKGSGCHWISCLGTLRLSCFQRPLNISTLVLTPSNHMSGICLQGQFMFWWCLLSARLTHLVGFYNRVSDCVTTIGRRVIPPIHLFNPFSFGHFIFLNYGFWLPLGYLKAFPSRPVFVLSS